MYHYSLNGALLEITCSDSQQEHVHEGRLPDRHSGRRDGQKRQHRRQFDDSTRSKEWRQKIGKELAVRFLLQPDHSIYMIILSSKPLLIAFTFSRLLFGQIP